MEYGTRRTRESVFVMQQDDKEISVIKKFLFFLLEVVT